MSFLADLPRAWVTVQIPGTAARGLLATYVGYAHSQVPDPPSGVTDLRWLERADRHPKSYLATSFVDAVQDISAQGVIELVGSPDAVPEDLARFLQDGGLRDRLRSATSSYFDLGDTAVEVDGGRLVHLISDSQWTFHWLLFVGEEGKSAIVATDFPVGFNLDAHEYEDADWLDEDPRYVLVADSFAEFIWRWWMDNEVFYQTVAEMAGLTTEQERYVAQYGHPEYLH